MIGAMGLESFYKRLQNYPREKLVVVVGDRLEIQDLAIRERVRCVIVTGGLPVAQSMIDFAGNRK
jgi:manganese-dependent inorganic pyrophosphatase